MSEPVSDAIARQPPSMFLGKGAAHGGEVTRPSRAPDERAVVPGLPLLIVLAFLVSATIGWLVLSGTVETWLRPTPKTELVNDLRRIPAAETHSTGVKG